MRGFPRLRAVHLEPGAEHFSQTGRILDRLRGVPVHRVAAPSMASKGPWVDPDKETLRLLPFRGSVLKSCPGTRGYICCGYQILQVGTNCPLDCSYCILQAYFNQPSLRVFVNLEQALEGIGQRMGECPEKIFRIGTGEFTDSLALDPVLGWTQILLPFISKTKNAVLELKTKTTEIGALLASGWRERVVVSWSLNSPLVAAREEKGAPGIRRRLLAARQCQEEGFALGFHFDPLIHHPDWSAGYRQTVEMMDQYIDPKGVIWVSLGSLRFMPHLKRVIRARHPDTHVLDGEFVPGLDGKMRYFRPIRSEMYHFVWEILKAWYRPLGIYLCMESDAVWQEALGWSPRNSEGLAAYLDQRVSEAFP